jgi:hypothetical protein
LPENTSLHTVAMTASNHLNIGNNNNKNNNNTIIKYEIVKIS